jgi:hypothetical protein
MLVVIYNLIILVRKNRFRFSFVLSHANFCFVCLFNCSCFFIRDYFVSSFYLSSDIVSLLSSYIFIPPTRLIIPIGFHDQEYRKRRSVMAKLADDYKYGDEIPLIEYTPDEIKTWGTVYDKLKSMHKSHACPEFLNIMPLLEKECGYSSTNIPQVRDICAFLKKRTGFQILS